MLIGWITKLTNLDCAYCEDRVNCISGLYTGLLLDYHWITYWITTGLHEGLPLDYILDYQRNLFSGYCLSDVSLLVIE